MENIPLISLSDLTFAYEGQSPLFDRLDFTFQPGTFYLIQGPSGAGKSTLLRLINRLEEPVKGQILFKGKPLSDYSPPSLRRSILYIQQKPTVIDGSIKDNLLLPFQFKNNQDLEKPGDERLRDLMGDFHLAELSLEDNAQALSLGQQQRVCFIRGLLLSPEIFLLDEPASALDQESARVVDDTSLNLCCDLGLTIIMVSHKNMEIDMTRVKPDVLRLEKGRLLKDQ